MTQDSATNNCGIYILGSLPYNLCLYLTTYVSTLQLMSPPYPRSSPNIPQLADLGRIHCEKQFVQNNLFMCSVSRDRKK
jgi:hypothetical protein